HPRHAPEEGGSRTPRSQKEVVNGTGAGGGGDPAAARPPTRRGVRAGLQRGPGRGPGTAWPIEPPFLRGPVKNPDLSVIRGTRLLLRQHQAPACRGRLASRQ